MVKIKFSLNDRVEKDDTITTQKGTVIEITKNNNVRVRFDDGTVQLFNYTGTPKGDIWISQGFGIRKTEG